MTCTDGGGERGGPDLVAFALGQLPSDEAAHVETHTAQCAACRAELAATKRLFEIAREAPAIELPSGGEARLLAAFRAERAGAPAPEVADLPPPAVKRRGIARMAAVLAPLAAAAAILVAVFVASRERPAEVIDGEGFFRTGDETASPAGIVGKFAFDRGAEIEAGRSPFTVRLTLPAGPPAGPSAESRATADDRSSVRPPPGCVELTLLPGARVARRGEGELELLAGRIDVVAGPLAGPFTVHAPPGRAVIRGTRFSASTTEKRLVVSVRAGSVLLGRDDGPSETLGPGEEGLVDAERLMKRACDGRRDGEGFLTPRAALRVEAGPSGGARLAASLEVGEGGAVSILPFDDSEPRFLLRLKGDDGREREVKLQHVMLATAPPSPESRTWRLAPGRKYDFAVDPRALGLAPGRYEARLRYMSYRARSDGAEWLGVTESDPVTIEVPVK